MSRTPQRTDRATAPSGGDYPGTPRWVKVAGIIGLVAVLVIVIILVAGGGHTPPIDHGP